MPEPRFCHNCLHWEQQDGMDGSCWLRVYQLNQTEPIYMRGDVPHFCVDFEPRELAGPRCVNCAHWRPSPNVYNMGFCPSVDHFWPGHYGRLCHEFMPRAAQMPDTFAAGVLSAE